MATQGLKDPIDDTMDRASCALEKTEYFLAERLAREALGRARAAADFHRMARIVLPLLEARRQKRQLATDIARNTRGAAVVIDDPAIVNAPPLPGCFLFQPPATSADSRAYHDAADAAGVPIFILSREPMTSRGLWPIVAVGQVTIRVEIKPPEPPAAAAPPWPARRVEDSVTGDDVRPETHTVPLAWFEAAAERLGDAAIAELRPAEPAARHVDDLMAYIDAFPDHEKLHQRLEEACIRVRHEDLPPK